MSAPAERRSVEVAEEDRRYRLTASPLRLIGWIVVCLRLVDRWPLPALLEQVRHDARCGFRASLMPHVLIRGASYCCHCGWSAPPRSCRVATVAAERWLFHRVVRRKLAEIRRREAGA